MSAGAFTPPWRRFSSALTDFHSSVLYSLCLIHSKASNARLAFHHLTRLGMLSTRSASLLNLPNQCQPSVPPFSVDGLSARQLLSRATQRSVIMAGKGVQSSTDQRRAKGYATRRRRCGRCRGTKDCPCRRALGVCRGICVAWLALPNLGSGGSPV